MTNAPENIVRMKRGKIVTHYTCGTPHIELVDVITDSPDGVTRAYIPCEEVGRAAVGLDRLQVWAIDFERLGRLVAAAIGFNGRVTQLAADRVWMLGTGRFLDRTREVFLIRGICWPDGCQTVAA